MYSIPKQYVICWSSHGNQLLTVTMIGTHAYNLQICNFQFF